METRRTRYEIVVATLLNKASLAAFRLGTTPTIVPRRTMYRLRVPADRDLSEVLHRLTDHDVQVVEIRQCVEPEREARTGGREPQPASGPQCEEPAVAAPSVVVPFARGSAGQAAPPARRPAAPPARDDGDESPTSGSGESAGRARRGRPRHLRAVPC